MNAWMERLGWTWIHSLWIGSVVWLTWQATLLAISSKRPQIRYITSCLALLVAVIAPWILFAVNDLSARLHRDAEIFQYEKRTRSFENTAPPTPPRSKPVFSPLTQAVPESLVFAQRVRPWLQWVTGFWLVGVLVFSLRFVRSWNVVNHLVHTQLHPLSEAWAARFIQLCDTAGVRCAVRIGESALVSVPIVVGWLKPIILLPVGFVTGLPSWQVEVILLHELAHIRRHDYFINLLQLVCETVFFYHPAIWLISHRIRIEREQACDDLAVCWCGDGQSYAEALVALEESRANSFAIAATGNGDLFERVRRLVVGEKPRRRTTSVLGIFVLMGVALYLSSMFFLPLFTARAISAAQRIALIKASQPRREQLLLQYSEGTKPEIRLFGALRTEDGAPLPQNISLYSLTTYNSGSEIAYVASRDGKFERKQQPGIVSLSAWAPGYSPTYIENLDIKDSAIGPVEILLRHGIQAQIQIIDDGGRMVEGAKIEGHIDRNGFPSLTIPSKLSDVSGIAVLGEVLSDSAMILTISKPDWQTATLKISSWTANEKPLVTLRKSVTTSGVVIDEETGQPVIGAELSLAMHLSEAAGTQYFHNDLEPLGHTDATGRFQIKDLNQNDSYAIYVRSNGHRLSVFPIVPGGPNTKLALKKGLVLRGRILDPKHRLTLVGKTDVDIRCQLTINVTVSQGMGYSLTQKLFPKGDEVPFEFRDLPPCDYVILSALGNEYHVNLQQDIDDYIIDLGKDSPKEYCNVELSLDPGSGQPPPEGQLIVGYARNGTEKEYVENMTTETFSIAKGKVNLKVPRPNRMLVFSDKLIGYGFRHDAIVIPENANDFSARISVFPSGNIRGKVVTDPSIPQKNFFTGVLTIKPALGMEYGFSSYGSDHLSSGEVMERYLTKPLPLGGTYRVVLWQGATFVVGPPVILDAARPVVDCDLHRPAGQTIRGKLVDDTGKPIGFQELELQYDPEIGPGYTCGGIATTNKEGEFVIEHVNFDVPGKYMLQPSDTYPPTKWEHSAQVLTISSPIVITAHRKK